MGSVPNVAATADVSHPAKQGLVQTLGVYLDTLIICSVTAFIILFTFPDVQETADANPGAELTQMALVNNFGTIGAVALAVIGGLLMWVFQQSSAATAYLTVNKQVDRGTVIEQSMLSTVEVVGEPANLIPAQNSRQVIGKVATADLAPGTTVTGQNTAESLGVETGRTVVGLALSSGRLPGRELKAGDQVQVVYTPNAEAAGAALSQAPIPAVVEGTGHDAAWGAKDAASVILGASAAPAPQQQAEPAPAESASAPASASPGASEDAKKERDQ